MTAQTGREAWHAEFGVAEHGDLFIPATTHLSRVAPHASQAHVARRAFDLLALDGVLCNDNAPLVYFKRVTRIDNIQIAALHRTFWNHGGAPILALIAPDQIHVYSGFVRPIPTITTAPRHIPAFVVAIQRASPELRAFLPAVQSGEFLRRHPRSFDPSRRVDRDLLQNLQSTRDKLLTLPAPTMDPNALDALLCRLVFACYLFDRAVIGKRYLKQLGLPHATHLTDILALRPRTTAKNYLYSLFERLRTDFNGDLFNDDLPSEARLVSDSHIEYLEDFFRATDSVTGQRSFWPYDFSAIPIETISAIYERFLETPQRPDGAFYTPRFLAELVLDIALSSSSSLLHARYLDPACGSGIFLVGLFNRIAEEWKQAHPDAPNDRKAAELRRILCDTLYGIDINPTACRITAFSLYLAYLDQLSPRDIDELRAKGHGLPQLVNRPRQPQRRANEGNITCGDFFLDAPGYPRDIDVLVGNPPWRSTADLDTPAGIWFSRNDATLTPPDKQIATAFLLKAPHHVKPTGRLCLVLPHGVLFNRSTTALRFQRALFTRHTVDHILNLADHQRFLFETAGHPAVVMSYRKSPPKDPLHSIQYSIPKVDWLATRSEVIAVAPQDRTTVTMADLLLDLDNSDAPQIWKRHFWGTPRDRRLIDRLSLLPRLRDHVRQVRESAPSKPWVMAAGVQGLGPSDDPAKAEVLPLPSRSFIDARSRSIAFFVIPSDCTQLPLPAYTVRAGSNKDTTVFRAPHVLVKEGFAGAAYADFDVSFLFSLRGISGPPEDRERLIFLAAYLSTALARFFLFHTSSGWGVSRQRVGVDELLRLPFPLPEALPDPRRAARIIKDIAEAVTTALTAAQDNPLIDRPLLVHHLKDSIETWVDEYFDILPFERALIDDTVNVTIPSARPTRKRRVIPTIEPADDVQRRHYTGRLCATLNEWSRGGAVLLDGHATASGALGVGVVILERGTAERRDVTRLPDDTAVLTALQRLSAFASIPLGSLELVRGIKAFDHDRLYIVKPLGRRFWTDTAALNDADEIAGSILMRRANE